MRGGGLKGLLGNGRTRKLRCKGLYMYTLDYELPTLITNRLRLKLDLLFLSYSE